MIESITDIASNPKPELTQIANVDNDRRSSQSLPANRGPFALQKMILVLKAKGVLIIVPDNRNVQHVTYAVADALARGGLIRASDVLSMDLYLQTQLITTPAGQFDGLVALKAKQTSASDDQQLDSRG